MEDPTATQNDVDASPDVVAQKTWDETVQSDGSLSQVGAGLSAVGKPLQSTNFVQGQSGWRINSNGEAEFQNITIRPTTYTFTDSGTFTLPTNSRLVYVECWGGGGSGAAANAATNGTCACSGGGGGEYRSAFYFTSILTADVTVTIGDGGVAKTTSGRQALDGAAGSATTFGSYLTANGGVAGDSDMGTGTSNSSGLSAAGGTGGSSTFIAVANENGGASGQMFTNGSTCAHTEAASAGASNSGGAGGGASGNNPCASGYTTAGGVSINGGSGGAGSNTTATIGSVPGGGGGGAANKDATVTSGAGGKGMCRVTLF